MRRFSRKANWLDKFLQKNIDAKFHEDPTDRVITDSRKQRDGRTDPTDGVISDSRKQRDGRTDLISIQGVLFYFVKIRHNFNP